jgi:hypothetical protein
VKHRVAVLTACCLVSYVALPRAQVTAPTSFTMIDASGLEMMVTDLVFDYTHYPVVGFYTPDQERGGFRVLQGSGQLTMRWSDIVTLKLQPERMYYVDRDGKRLEFAASEESKWRAALKDAVIGTYGEVYKYPATVQLRSGMTRSVLLIPVTKALSAKSDLGDYSVLLEKVTEIRVIR